MVRILHVLFALVATLILATPVQAQLFTPDFVWGLAGGGTWASAANWSPIGVPTIAETVGFNSTTTAAATLTLDSNQSVLGLQVTNPGGAITINTGVTTTNTLTIGASGIDMSVATQNLTINASLVAAATQTWNLNAGRTLSLWAVNTSKGLSGSGNITLVRSGTGTATVVFLPGATGSVGFADANGNASYTGNWTVGDGMVVQMIRNGRTAWGSGSITLSGGQIAQVQGNWTWTNNIVLTNETSSSIANSSTGTSRTLKLQGVLSGSGNLTFLDTTGAMTGADNGFIITGVNTLNGVVTIPASRLVRIGGLGGDVTGTGVGPDGTLGTASIVLNGTLTLSRNNTWTFDNAITSGSGVLRIGLATGSATHIVTVMGNNQHTGGTTLQSAVTLNIGHPSALGTGPFTIAGNGIFDNLTGSPLVLGNAFTMSGGNPSFTGTNDLTFNGAGLIAVANRTITVNSGTLALGGVIAQDVAGRTLTKAGGGILVLGGANGYTGVTNVNAGTLLVNGSLSTGGAAANAGTLGGNGSIGGPTSVAAAATLAPGNAAATAGTLSIAAATTLAGTYQWELAVVGAPSVTLGGSSPAATHDRVPVTGTLNATGAIVNITSLAVTGFDHTQPYSWVIATSAGLTGAPTLGTISGADFSNPAGGTFSLATDSNNIYVNFTPVPEPVALLALTTLTLLGAYRRRG